MSAFVVIIVSVLVGLFALLSLQPVLSEGSENDSLVHLHE